MKTVITHWRLLYMNSHSALNKHLEKELFKRSLSRTTIMNWFGADPGGTRALPFGC